MTGARSRVREIVIEDRAIGRIGGSGFIRRKRRIGVGVALDAVGRSRREKMRVATAGESDFPQRRDVIENPERAAMGGDDEIVVVNPEIAHGSVRQIQLQRLPVIAIVKRNPDGIFRAGKQQAFAHRIFAHRVDRAEIGQAGGDQLPGLAAIVRAVDVRMQVVDAEAADGGVGGCRRRNARR